MKIYKKYDDVLNKASSIYTTMVKPKQPYPKNMVFRLLL